MATNVTIGGRPVTILSESLRITHELRVPSECRLDVRYTEGPEPRQNEEVRVTHDGDLVFVGTITKPGKVNEQYGRVLFKVLAEDFLKNFRHAVIAKVWQNVTLKAILTEVLAEVRGVTLHPDQVDGPTFERIASNYYGADKVIRDLSDLAQMTYSVDTLKRFRMHGITEVAAPAQLTDGSDLAIGDIDDDGGDDSEFVNQVTVVGDPIVSNVFTETHTGGIPFVDRGDADTVPTDVIYAVDTGTNPDRMYEIQTNGTVRTITLTGLNVGRGSNFVGFGAINGRLYVADRTPNPDALYEIQPDGTVRTINLSQAVPAIFTFVGGVINDRLYFYDAGNFRLWNIQTTGTVSFVQIPGSQRPQSPNFGAAIGDSIYMVATGANPDRMYRVRTDGTVTLITLTGTNIRGSIHSTQVLGVINERMYVLERASNPDLLYEIDTNGNVRAITLTGTNIGDQHAAGVINGRLYVADTAGNPDRLYSITTEGAVSRVNLSTNVPHTEFWGVVPDVPIRREYYRLFTEQNVHQVTALTREGNPESIAADDSGQWKTVPGQPYILRTKSGVALRNTDDLSISYTFLIPVIARKDNAQGGELYSKAFHLGSITQAEADEAATIHLRKYGRLIRHIGIRTLTRGFRPGQSLTVLRTDPPIAGAFLIDKVRYWDADGVTLMGMVSAGDAEGDDDWREFFGEGTRVDLLNPEPVLDRQLRRIHSVFRTGGEEAPAITTDAAENYVPPGWALISPGATAFDYLWRADRDQYYVDDVFQRAEAWRLVRVAAPTQTEHTWAVYRRGGTDPPAITNNVGVAQFVPPGWSASNPGPTSTLGVWRATRTEFRQLGVFSGAGGWIRQRIQENVPSSPSEPVLTTENAFAYRFYPLGNPPAVPTGGSTVKGHQPRGWTRSSGPFPARPAGQGIIVIARIEYFIDGVFSYADPWGGFFSDG